VSRSRSEAARARWAAYTPEQRQAIISKAQQGRAERQQAGPLTDRQRRMLEFIRSAIREDGYPPAIREIGDAVGLASSSSVHAQLLTLESKGFIRRTADKPRAIKLLDGAAWTAEMKDRIRAQVLAARKAQGLPDTVPASRFLAELADQVLAQDTAQEVAA